MIDTREMQRLTFVVGAPLKFRDGRRGWFVREAEARDAGELMHYCHTIADEPGNNTSLRHGLIPTGADGYRAMIRDYRDHPTSHLLLATDGERVGGLVKLTGSDFPLVAHSVELSINVCADFRGQGVGTQLLDHAVRWARAHGSIRRVWLEVLARNEAARALYARYGFQVEGLKRAAYRLTDESPIVEHDAYIMALLLHA